ncbi:MAG: transcription antitermination factor NusB [Puniceicoccaceae bacterium]
MSEKVKAVKQSRRRANRIAAMQFLYAWEANPSEVQADGFYTFFENLEKPREYFQFGEELARGAVERLGEVDDKIRKVATNWDFSRIAKVDLAILRLAVYELYWRTDIPPVVSINEAIDIGKEFSSEESKRFINGVLDKLKGGLNRPLRTSVAVEDLGF